MWKYMDVKIKQIIKNYFQNLCKIMLPDDSQRNNICISKYTYY